MTTTFFTTEPFIRPRHLMQQFGISRKTLYNWIRMGILPKQRRIAPHVVVPL